LKDGEIIHADLIIGADGIHVGVFQCQLNWIDHVS
jgi:hypothetical protein